MTTNDFTVNVRPSLPIRIGPPRRHSDGPLLPAYQQQQSPRGAFSYVVTGYSGRWPSLCSPDEDTEFEDDVLGAHHPEATNNGDPPCPTVSELTPKLKAPQRPSYAPSLTPRIATPYFGAEDGIEEDSLDSTFAVLHDSATDEKPNLSYGGDASPLEEPRGRQLGLPRINSTLSSGGWSSRSSSRDSSYREMSPDDWTKRMIKQNKVDASVAIQAQTACSSAQSGESPIIASSPTLPQSPPAPIRKSDSAASDSLASFARRSSGTYFSRRQSDQAHYSTPTSPSDLSASQTALSRYLSSADLTPPQSPASPRTPADDQHQAHGSFTTGIDHFVESMTHIRHSVGSSLRRASHFGGTTPPSPVAWSDIKAINVRFRVKRDSGVNSFLLGLNSMQMGGGTRAWDPRGPPEPDGGSLGTAKTAADWPSVSSTYGEPPSVEIMAAVLLPP